VGHAHCFLHMGLYEGFDTLDLQEAKALLEDLGT
jgi:hypothetical protein